MTDQHDRDQVAVLGAQPGIAVHVALSPRHAGLPGDLVPVVLVDGRELGYWRIEEARLRHALA